MKVASRSAAGAETSAKGRDGRVLYWWLLLAVFLEYARPGYQFPVLLLLPLNSAVPLSLLLVSLVSGGQRPWSEIVKDSMWKWPLLMVAFVLVSMLWASVTTYAYNTFSLILGYLILYVLMVRIITTLDRLRGLFITLIVSHLFLLIYNPLVVTEPYIRHYIAGATFLGDGNDFSLSLVILLPFALALAQSAGKKFWRIAWYVTLVVLILAIVGTQSRGATLGMAATFGYLWWRSDRKGPGIAAIVAVLFGILLYAPDVYFERLSTLRNPGQESSAEGRIQAWRAGTRMAQDNILGVGAGNFPNNFPKYRSSNAPLRWMTAHSMYFLILGELGILGLLLLIHLIWGNIRANVKQRTMLSKLSTGPPEVAFQVRLLDLTIAGALGLAVSGAFLSVTYYPHLFVLTAICVCVRALGLELGQAPVQKVEKPTAGSRFARLT